MITSQKNVYEYYLISLMIIFVIFFINNIHMKTKKIQGKLFIKFNNNNHNSLIFENNFKIKKVIFDLNKKTYRLIYLKEIF